MSKTIHIGDVQNALVRFILWRSGEAPDSLSRLQAGERVAIDHFGGLCAYCAERPWVAFDHASPINRDHLGLHRIGNRVPSCKECNDEKGGRLDFREFLNGRPKGEERIANIVRYMRDNGYTPLEDDPKFKALIESARADVAAVASKCIADFNDLLRERASR
jgi:hypothetical protein